MSNFPPTTDELFETFEDLEEWDERYDFIIDLGRELPTLPTELQTEDNIVKGCMSTVWVVTDVEEQGDIERLNIQADSDSIIVKGLIVLLLAFYNNMSPSRGRNRRCRKLSRKARAQSAPKSATPQRLVLDGQATALCR